MNKLKKYFIISFSILIVIISFYSLKNIVLGRNKANGYGNSEREVIIQSQKFKLEEVRSAEKMSLGLGGRESLCEHCGMIFLFPEKGRHSFWMKGMKLPLDIFWIQGDNIVHVEKNIPADSQEIMNPAEAADKVIELAAGTADKFGIGNGTAVLPFPGKVFSWERLKKIFGLD
jgi:uncharacterized membrane protein (UPF0127 family)